MKKALALLLGLCLLAALFAPAASAKTGPSRCKCGEVPQVMIKGFLKPLYYNQGTGRETPAGPISHIWLDKQGNSMLPVTQNWSIDPAQDHSVDPEFEVLHDYRLDTFAAAARLHDFIETLCEVTGHEKIALTGRSHGTSIIMTYLKVYGPGRLDALILNNGTFQGSTLLGEVMLGRFALSGPALINLLEALAPDSEFVTASAKLLRKMPLMGFTLPLTRSAVSRPVDVIYEKTLIELLKRMPSVWAMLPEPYFAKARPLLDGDPAYAYLRELVDRYHDEVQAQAARLLLGAKNAGVKVAIFASYGKAPVPLTHDTSYQCDFLADTACESGGATVAPMGQTLPQSKSKYRSPDGIIDAASCILPDNTWFVKYNSHFNCPRDLQQWIIRAKQQPTIYDNAKFPQYLRVTDEEDTVFLDGQSVYTAPLKETPAAPFAGTR